MRAAQILVIAILSLRSALCESSEVRPNILFFIVDELRKPVAYETEELHQWSRENLKTMTFLQENGVNFDHHYTASTGCAPSRASLFTGQYPTLHGVSQTDGAAKPAFDPTMFWLDPFTVPTAGNIFKEASYRTFYNGKWHISKADLLQPGSQNPLLTYDSKTGKRNAHLENIYRTANMLGPYGFDNGWIGPEPHGTVPHNTGASAAFGASGRDSVFADETVSLLQRLNQEDAEHMQPWFIVCSFVNPHDITLYGDSLKNFPQYNFSIDPTLPEVPPSPTAREDLSTKPLAQRSYREQYQNAFQSTTDTEDYRKLYYTLQKKVDYEMGRVLSAWQETSFHNNTIVVFTSDHGELLGAHGIFQKWFNMYEESIHIPFTLYSPTLLPKNQHVNLITSHVDLLPTLCGLANLDPSSILQRLRKTFSESRDLVGRDLSKVVLGTISPEEIETLREPIFFLTYDQVLTGSYTISILGVPFEYINQPAFIHAIVVQLTDKSIWKFAMYFTNADFTQAPKPCDCSSPVEVPETVQFEMYNLTSDPLETRNLADSEHETTETVAVRAVLMEILEKQFREKGLKPAPEVSKL